LDAAGRVTAAEVARRLRPDTVLCSVLHANNETGIVNDVRAIAAICAERGVPCHVDGVQAVGHLPSVLSDLGANFYTFSAHKFGAPRGAGGLFIRGAQAEPLLRGGGHESGLRAGTENVAAIAAAAVALHESLAILPAEIPRLRALADRFVAEVTRRCPSAVLNSDPAEGLPGLVSISFPGLLASELVAELGLQGYALSAGSACHSNTLTPSRVLLAMGRTEVAALGTVRVSMGRHTTERSASCLADALCRAAARHLALDTAGDRT
jgi:cysteine desulfurase